MSSKLRVFVTSLLPDAAVNLLRERFAVTMMESDEVIPREALINKIQGQHGLLCLLTSKIDKPVLDAAGDQLKVVSTMSVGVNHIDLQECKRRSIKVGFTPDVLTSATADLGVSLLLATSRRLIEASHAAKIGLWSTWKPMWMCGVSLEGSTVGIFGLGRIGQAIVRRLKPFGVACFKYNSLTQKSAEFENELGVSYASFDDLLATSDFLVCCTALTSLTKEIFNASSFAKMKQTSIFINIARGEAVQQDDLYSALVNGQIRAAGLDVATPEPLPPDHPLYQLQNCVILPHIGSATEETRTSMAVLAAKNLIAGLEDKEMPAEYQI